MMSLPIALAFELFFFVIILMNGIMDYEITQIDQYVLQNLSKNNKESIFFIFKYRAVFTKI